MLKDTCVWGLFSALSLFFNIYKARDFSFFKNVLKDSAKLIVIVEFIINLYIFPFAIELILLPLIIALTMMQTYSEIEGKRNKEHKKTTSCLNKLMSIIGIVVIVYSSIMAIKYGNLFSADNLKIFFLPIVLTILSIPYFYILALCLEYESVFIAIKHTRRNDDLAITRDMIKATLLYANVNINKLSRIWKYHALLETSDNPYEYIKRISKKPKYTLGNTSKIPIFNDIRIVLKVLSSLGLGVMDDWRKLGDEYSSIMKYYLFGNDDITHIPNTLAFYLTGGEDFVNKLELALDIGYQQDYAGAMTRFRIVAESALIKLGISYPIDLILSIDALQEFHVDFEQYSIDLKFEKFDKVDSWVLSVVSK